MESHYTCGIIGAGRLGSVLAKAFGKQKKLTWLLSRSKKIPDDINVTIGEISFIPQIILIATNDDSIGEVADELARHFRRGLEGVYIAHCSGFVPLSSLQPCKNYGAIVASIHPYQTFYYPSLKNLRNITWGIDCEPRERDFFGRVIADLQGNAYFLDFESELQKSLYHISAVSASNFLTSALSLSRRIFSHLGISPENFLKPIVRTTVGNALKFNKDSSSIPLTGPVARGDFKTINNHIQALENNKELLKPYCYFSLAAAEMAYNAKMLTDIQFSEITKILKEKII
ncbi:MAG: pyrroline-5-carboxylate reductase [Ignavibacteria bacterium]|nr:pyrroline-5-carboxylate reductase [Ignavibacteria bacterium]